MILKEPSYQKFCCYVFIQELFNTWVEPAEILLTQKYIVSVAI